MKELQVGDWVVSIGKSCTGQTGRVISVIGSEMACKVIFRDHPRTPIFKYEKFLRLLTDAELLEHRLTRGAL